MLSKKHRLTKKEFNAVFKNGVVLRSPHFLVRAVRDVPHFKCAAVAGKKVGKTAVARNTLRRKVYAGVATCIRDTHVLHGAFIFFILTPTLPHHTELCGEIERVLLG